jgi:hypothetical protein
MAFKGRRWFNPSQPQTLVIATWLLYIDGVLGLLGFFSGNPLALISGLASAAAAFGIANEQKWGYGLGIAVSVLELVLLVVIAGGFTGLVRGTLLIPFLFAIALVAALLHPLSREYQKVWFE